MILNYVWIHKWTCKDLGGWIYDEEWKSMKKCLGGWIYDDEWKSMKKVSMFGLRYIRVD